MSQNVLVRNAIGRKGRGLLCLHSFHPWLQNRQEVTLSASRLGTLFLEIGSSEHATQSGKIQDRLVLCQQTRRRTLQLRLFQGLHSILLGCAAGTFTQFPSCHHQPEAHFQVWSAQEKQVTGSSRSSYMGGLKSSQPRP